MVVLRCSSRRWCDRCLALQWTASVACRWSFSRFWDDEVLPLICPTCQVAFGLTENANAGNHLATVHGVVFDVLGGSRGARRDGTVRKGRRLFKLVLKSWILVWKV